MTALTGRVALITGAGSGIGKATAQRFVEVGARVVLADINVETGEATAQAIDSLFIKVDVSDPTAVDQAVVTVVEEHKRLDIIVNNAGIVPEPTSLHRLRDEDLKRVIDIDLNGVVYGMRAAIRQFLRQGSGGCVVNTASTAGLGGMVGFPSYVAAKAGIINLTRAAAVEYGGNRIRVNAVAPSMVRTEAVVSWIESADDPHARLKHIEAMNPLIGIIEPSDVAAAIAFLASDDARFISGVTLPVDGGYTAK